MTVTRKQTHSDQMPERYRPDPWVDSEVKRSVDGRLRARISVTVLRWIDAEIGDTVNVAPKSDSAVKIGYDVPNILGEIQIHKEGRGRRPVRKLPSCVIDYLDVEDGDMVRFHKTDKDHFVVKLLMEGDDG